MTEAASPKKPKSAVKLVLVLFGVGFFFGGGCCVLAIALPSFVSDRKHSNESAAIGALKTIATSETIFREGDKDQNGALDYGSLAQLSQADLVDSVLGSGTKQGYFFAAAASSRTSEFIWFATAAPAVPGASGRRYFCTNQDGVVYYTTTGSFALNTTDGAIPANAVQLGR